MATALTLHMEARGKHSWGLYRGDTREIIKGTGYPSMNVNPEDVAYSDLMLLHTRFASVGAITVENTHPWEFSGSRGSLVGIHNGGIADYEKLNKDLGRNFNVDSMHIFQHIAEGLDVEELRGYGAIAYTWIDSEDRNKLERIYLGKFNNGSLAIFGIVPKVGGEDKKKEDRLVQGIIFASTAEACRVAIKMAGYGYDEYIDYQVDSGVLYRLDANKEEKDIFWRTIGVKGLELSHYSRDAARNAKSCGWTSTVNGGWNRQKDIPSKGAIAESIRKGFRGLRGWELATYFIGLDRYMGTEKCKNCSILGDVEFKPTKEIFCVGHWIHMVNQQASCVIPIKEVAEHIRDSGPEHLKGLVERVDIPEAKDEVLGAYLCEICEINSATHWEESSRTLACLGCTQEWDPEAPWVPVAGLGKDEGADSEELDDKSDDTLPVIDLSRVESDEEKVGDSAPVPPTTPRAYVQRGRILCEDCVEHGANDGTEAEYSYKVYMAETDNAGKRRNITKTYLLCHVCKARRELARDQHPEIYSTVPIKITDPSWIN